MVTGNINVIFTPRDYGRLLKKMNTRTSNVQSAKDGLNGKDEEI